MNQTPIKSFLRQKIDEKIFSGCSFIFGKPFKKMIDLQLGTIGFNNNQLINQQTKFDLQSITKAIATAPLIQKLVEQRHLNLNDRASALIKNSWNQLDHNITLSHLLTHSSGLSDNDIAVSFNNQVDFWKKMFSAKSHFLPGTAIEYSDLGYRIIGKIIEIIMGVNLEIAAYEAFWKPLGLKFTSYSLIDPFNIAATPNAHGAIDDEQVHFLGGILGCDGLFSSADDLFIYLSHFINGDILNMNSISSLQKSTLVTKQTINSFFESLAFGPKNFGWEINERNFSYSGKFQNINCFEKAGGAGTFIWFDMKSEYIFIYLTNHGKPKPFIDTMWNQLLKNIAPHDLSNIIYENL